MKVPPRPFMDAEMFTVKVRHGWDIVVEVRALDPLTEDRAIDAAFCYFVDYLRAQGCDPVKMAARVPPPTHPGPDA